MEEGIVTRWLVDDGAAVTKGQEILEFETDKINAAVESPADGVLGGIAAQPGDIVKVQGLLAYVLEPGEEAPAPEPAAEPAPAAAPAPPAPAASAPPAVAAAPSPTAPAPAAPPMSDGRLKASPLARRLARDLGVDISRVSGSGPGGRVIELDVRASAAAAVAAPAPAPMVALPVPAELPAGASIPMTGVRRVIAERMTQSLREAAQLTLVAEADATRFQMLREDLAAQREAALGFRISYNDLLIRICAHALREHPRLNARLAGDQIELLDHVNIGLAVEAGQDLVVPNVKQADRKSVAEIATDLRALVQRAQGGSLALDDISGGTFTISNLGLYDVDAFTPVINPPEAAILGVGAIREKAVVVDGELAARPSVTLSLTIDHRIVDGAPGARFLQRIKQLIEQPFLLI